jgi:glycosyltransferase involved in cell wall biosynthesis
VIALIVCHSSAKEVLGGGELSILQLITYWREHYPEWEFRFVVPDAEGLLPEALSEGGFAFEVVHSIPWLMRHPPTSLERRLEHAEENERAVQDLRSLIVAIDADLVITNTVVGPWGAVAAGLEGVPHAWLVREYGNRDHGLTFVNGEAQTWGDIGKLSTIVVTNSRAIEDYVSAWIPRSKLEVSYPPIGDDVRTDLLGVRAPDTEETGPLRLLLAGKLTRSKGVFTAIEALAEARKSGVDAVLTLVGNLTESDRADIRGLVASLDLDSAVTIVGAQPTVVPLISESDVGLVLSPWEAFGRITAEFMLAGRPVIGVDQGGTAELISDGTTGVLVPAEDVSAVARAIVRYAATRSLVLSHGQSARRLIEALYGDQNEALLVAKLIEVAGRSTGMLPEVLMPRPGLAAEAAARIKQPTVGRGQKALRRLTRRFSSKRLK